MADPPSTPSGYPPGVSAPLTAVTPTNQSGIIAILTGFSFGLVLLSTGVRIHVRRGAGAFRADDLACYAAVLFAIVQTSIVFWMVSLGLGKVVELLSATEVAQLQRGELTSNIFYILVLFCSKASCALMFLWITPFQTQKKVVWAMISVCFVWLVTSLFLEGFTCHGIPNRCQSYFKHWLYISIFDIVIEVALILTITYIIWSREMTVQEKLSVVGAFATRAPNIACTIVRLVFLDEPLTATSSSYWTAKLQSTTQLAIGYTVTACVIPYLRPLMQAYDFPDGQPRSFREPSFKLSLRSSVAAEAGRHNSRSDNTVDPVLEDRGDLLSKLEKAVTEGSWSLQRLRSHEKRPARPDLQTSLSC